MMVSEEQQISPHHLRPPRDEGGWHVGQGVSWVAGSGTQEDAVGHGERGQQQSCRR
jgi:hypothetical protein